MIQDYKENFGFETVEESQGESTTFALPPENRAGLSEVCSSQDVEGELHIYVNGNREKSGDGLTPADAVATCGDAMGLLEFYDSCNAVGVVHFASLEAGREYPPICLSREKMGNFRKIRLEGESHESTMLSLIEAYSEGNIEVTNLCLRFAHAHHQGRLLLSGAMGLRPNVCTGSLGASFAGDIRLAANTKLHVDSGVYPWMFRATSGGELHASKTGIAVTFSPNVYYTRAFVVSEHSGVCYVKVPEYTGKPKGKRYIARFNGGVITKSSGRGIMPGNEAGVVCHGGYYF